MSHGAADTTDAHEHPSDRKYIQIAIILAIITLVEVAIYYIDWVHDTGVLVPALIVLSLAKFVTVIGYYMHLKFDAPLFRYMFGSGLAVSVAVIGALVALEVTHRIDYSFGLL